MFLIECKEGGNKKMQKKASSIKPKRKPNPLVMAFKKPNFSGGRAPKPGVISMRRNSFGGGGGRGK